MSIYKCMIPHASLLCPASDPTSQLQRISSLCGCLFPHVDGQCPLHPLVVLQLVLHIPLGILIYAERSPPMPCSRLCPWAEDNWCSWEIA